MTAIPRGMSEPAEVVLASRQDGLTKSPGRRRRNAVRGPFQNIAVIPVVHISTAPRNFREIIQQMLM